MLALRAFAVVDIPAVRTVNLAAVFTAQLVSVLPEVCTTLARIAYHNLSVRILVARISCALVLCRHTSALHRVNGLRSLDALRPFHRDLRRFPNLPLDTDTFEQDAGGLVCRVLRHEPAFESSLKDGLT